MAKERVSIHKTARNEKKRSLFRIRRRSHRANTTGPREASAQQKYVADKSLRQTTVVDGIAANASG